MTAGKIASQAGHAYLGAFLEAQKSSPDTAAAYSSDLPGTKVCLQATLSELLRAKAEAEAAGLPTFLVVDSGCENFFGGAETLTALGIACTKRKASKTLRKLKLL